MPKEPDHRMSADHEAHLRSIKDRFTALVDAKYRKGNAEHGGKLWENDDLLKEAINEVIDLAVYLLTLVEQRNDRSAEERSAKGIDVVKVLVEPEEEDRIIGQIQSPVGRCAKCYRWTAPCETCQERERCERIDVRVSGCVCTSPFYICVGAKDCPCACHKPEQMKEECEQWATCQKCRRKWYGPDSYKHLKYHRNLDGSCQPDIYLREEERKWRETNCYPNIRKGFLEDLRKRFRD